MSGLSNGSKEDYSKFDRMSTESLEELLRLDADLPDGEESNIDEILYISEVIAKREKEHPTGRYPAADVDTAWEIFQTKYLPYATDGRSLYDFDDDEPNDTRNTALDVLPTPGKKGPSVRRRHRLGRVASVAAVIALLLCLTTVTTYAMGIDLWAVIAQWTKETFTFVSASKATDAERPSSDNTEVEYADLQAALDAYGITERLAPRWFPDNFILETVSVDESAGNIATIFWADYRCGEKLISIQINMYHDPPETHYATWQKDNIDIDTLIIENCTFYTMQNAEQECAIWNVGPFECNIDGDISSEELIKMLESIFA